jgi:iron only hydrogenase large subunit-like protein
MDKRLDKLMMIKESLKDTVLSTKELKQVLKSFKIKLNELTEKEKDFLLDRY